MVDDMCFIRSMHTEAINHEPAITYMQTGNQVTGRPCLGAWASLRPRLAQPEPADVRRPGRQADEHRSRCRRSRRGCGQSGYLPGEHAGVSFRTGGDPILYINNPPGVPPEVRRKTLDGLKQAQRDELRAGRRSRDAHAHPAVRDGLPHAVERARADRPRQRAGVDVQALRRRTAKKPGTFANTVLLARRLVERGVRFVQIYHNNWDTHGNVAGRLPDQCRTSISRAGA